VPRGPSVRRQRLSEAFRKELSELLMTEVKDPRLAGVVVTAVELSRDVKLAKAYFSVVGDAERERQAADGLKQASAFLRRQLGRRMRIHEPPQFEFVRDRGFEHADRVHRILDQLGLEHGAAEETQEGDDE